MHHTYNEEPVSIKQPELLKAIGLRDKIQRGELTQKEAQKILNSNIIMI